MKLRNYALVTAGYWVFTVTDGALRMLVLLHFNRLGYSPVAIAFLLAGPAGDKIVPYTTEIGITLLWISAVVTLYTGWDYFRSGLKHVI